MKKLKRFFKLKQFKNEKSSINNFEVSMEIKDNLFLLSYSICGNIPDIIIPGIENFTLNNKSYYQRRDELWKSTCFEFFIKEKNNKSYSEINVSPDYYYNVYSFNDYRTGMKQENSLSLKNIEKIKKDKKFILHFIIESEIPFKTDSLFVNISSVIQYSNGKTEYWALKHPKQRADFHDFDCFIGFSKKKH